MKRNVFVILLACCLLLSGCGGAAEPEQPEAAVSFTDDLGRRVTVEDPQRVAALLGSFAQVWQLAGGQVAAAPDDAWEDLKLELPEETVNLGGTKNLSLELLLASRPELVLASVNTRQNLQWQELLEGAGIPVAYFDINDFADYLRLLDICTDITGRKDLYERYGTQVQAQIESVLEQSRQRLERQAVPTVLCMAATASSVKAKNSEGSVLGAMLKALGCINIADSDTMLLETVSLEHILLADPDYIFIVQRGDDTEGMREYMERFLTGDPAWSSLTAVREGRVHLMDKNLFNLKPNHRWGEAYEILEGILEDGQA